MKNLLQSWKKHYQELKKIRGSHAESVDFNIFKIVSDLYYRENFHSDIIYELLKTQNGEGLSELIKMINAHGKIKLDIDDFRNASIKKEYTIENKRRIDILIWSKKSGKIIIIENKINNAPDQYRQIPDYVKYVNNTLKEEFEITKTEVVCVIYLPLIYKKPSKEGWTKEERANIYKILEIIPAYDYLCDNWITPFANNTTNHKVKYTLEQYKDLIIELSKKESMNSKTKEFYEILQNMGEEGLETALSIKKVIDELPKFRAKRIRDKFSTQPCNKFGNTLIWKNKNRGVWIAKFLEYPNNKIDLWLRIECWEKEYKITINEGKTFKKGNKTLSDFLDSKELKQFFKKCSTENEWHLKKVFNFPSYSQEKQLDSTIESILQIINSEDIDISSFVKKLENLISIDFKK